MLLIKLHLIVTNTLYTGFIIEAGIEALPQSLLQIIAIVYYNEANYVSIASIFLSMFSVMTKSLVFSQGIDIKTYLWTWLCIVTDFFGIFFILSWVFYSNDTLLQPEFIGYFTIIGEIWFYKIMISVGPCIIIIPSWWVITFLPGAVKGYADDFKTDNCNDRCWDICMIILIFIGGGIFVLIACAVGFIAIEIFCFSFLALALWLLSTQRWDGYAKQTKNEKLNGMLKFVFKSACCSKNDRKFRILAVASSIPEDIKEYDWYNINTETRDYITKIEKESGINGLQHITYSDLRNNCGRADYVRYAKFFPDLWYNIKGAQPDAEDFMNAIKCTSNDWDDKMWKCAWVLGYYLLFIAIPIFTLCKIVQGLFPYIILGYLLYYDELLNVDLFQLVMLFTFIGLQLILLILGINVFRIHHALWHIYPGRYWIPLKSDTDKEELMKNINNWYLSRMWIPLIQDYLNNLYGEDVTRIIMDYYDNIECQSVLI